MASSFRVGQHSFGNDCITGALSSTVSRHQEPRTGIVADVEHGLVNHWCSSAALVQSSLLPTPRTNEENF
jgi:hypothetical protein